MGSLLMDHIKKQASSFIQDKYKSARLALTDVTEAELLAEEATNGDQCSPDARTLTKIAEASYVVDDYWRIVDVLHRRLYCVDWKEWRQSYKSLILLEFLLKHGPEDFAEEFVCDTDVIHELGTFHYIDDKGFNWGHNMQRKSEEILKLIGGEKKVLREARLRALKVTREIQGFGSSTIPVSPLSLSSPSSSSASESSQNSSFGSFSTGDMNNDIEKIPQFLSSTKEVVESYSQGGIRDDEKDGMFSSNNKNVDGLQYIWDCPSIQETGSFLEGKDDEEEEEYKDEKEGGNGNFIGGIFSKITGFSPSKGGNGFRSVSDVGRVEKKKFIRQFSLWF